MRLYFDQMFHRDVAAAVLAAGHDVVRAAEVGQARADDQEILERAGNEGRVVVTLDSDFGDWSVLPLRRHAGVVRVKVRRALTSEILAVLLPFLKRHAQSSFANRLVIVSSRSERWINTAPTT